MVDFMFYGGKGPWWGSFNHFTAAGFLNSCSCRLHGESAIVEGTLNLALHVGDDSELVLANRRAYGEDLGLDPNKFTTCAQVHGTKVVQVTPELVGSGALDFSTTIRDTDALITDLPQVPLLLFFADCVPILLADPVTGAIGLAHAGWRGTVGEIAIKTVEAMVAAYGCRPENILGGIGPSIGPCCYEVDDNVRDRAAGYEEFFAPVAGKPGKYMLDLWAMNRAQLLTAGLKKEHIKVAEICTVHHKQFFCSYRAENGKTGRMGVCLAKV